MSFLRVAAAVAAIFVGTSASAITFGTVSVTNTFEDSVITGGAQTVFGTGSATISQSDVELPAFIGFYDIDITGSTLTMTLIDNSGATDLVLPADRFDRYYVAFDGGVGSATLVDGPGAIDDAATVSLIPAGFATSVADLFGTGLDTSLSFPNGGVLIEIGEGADLTELGQTISVELAPVPLPAGLPLLAIALGGLGFVAHRKRRN